MGEQAITLTIADRPYKLIVKEEDEAIFRDATQRINENIKGYSSNYAFKDRQDLLAMVALQYSTNAIKNERIQSYRDTELIEKLHQINHVLDEQMPTF